MLPQPNPEIVIQQNISVFFKKIGEAEVGRAAPQLELPLRLMRVLWGFGLFLCQISSQKHGVNLRNRKGPVDITGELSSHSFPTTRILSGGVVLAMAGSFFPGNPLAEQCHRRLRG